jgi:hypothetical protein
MPLEPEIQKSRQSIYTDGYDMSIGEITNLYKDGDLIIDPEFQRLFRWDASKKTKFIESIILRIPIPSIFVFQATDGKWELIDGLQRTSTILELMGLLKDPDGLIQEPLTLEGTKMLPSLAGKKWGESEEETATSLSSSQRIEIKRSRMRVEIIKKDSNPRSKFELFQRLNEGGAALTPQEIRNSVLVMLNPPFFRWLKALTEKPAFKATVRLTDNAEMQQRAVELATRFIVYRTIPYQSGLDVNEYLSEGIAQLATEGTLDLKQEESVFERTFEIVRDTVGDSAFKRFDGTDFTGPFLLSSFEVVAIGISHNLSNVSQQLKEDPSYLATKIRTLWDNETFRKNSGAGVRGTTRLANLVPFSMNYFSK